MFAISEQFIDIVVLNCQYIAYFTLYDVYTYTCK